MTKLKKSAVTFSLIAAICCLLSYSFQANALDKFAHQVVCQLAYNNLPSAQQQKIEQLLTLIPTQHQKLINRYNHQKSNASINFSKACTWADAIKKLPEYNKYKSWHYLNAARTVQHINKNTCDKNCITHAIIIHSQQLQQTQQWSKTQALLFLGHWLGDIHQPLHVSFASDLGGNKVKISSPSKCNNLHWYWDECLLKNEGLTFNDKLKQLQKQWQQTPVKLLRQTIDKNLTASWANESFQMIQQASFQYCRSDGNSCLPRKQKVVINSDYDQHYLPIYNMQLLKAAQRLYLLLMQYL